MTPGSLASRRQRGTVLIVVLILLIVMTLLGLASLRGTLLEERMSAAMFDRSLAFQAAESALRVAEEKVRQASVDGQSIGVDCTAAGVICPATPMDAAVATAACTPNAPRCWVSVTEPSSYSGKVAGVPQYYIEFMGSLSVSADDGGAGRSASGNQYGAPPPTYSKAIYRISARSQNPVRGRALVALQATVEVR
ncbi:MAG TPA: PilX N-terminal domain-containing pilus assembly protein [Lysobacter sp.]